MRFNKPQNNRNMSIVMNEHNTSGIEQLTSKIYECDWLGNCSMHEHEREKFFGDKRAKVLMCFGRSGGSNTLCDLLSNHNIEKFTWTSADTWRICYANPNIHSSGAFFASVSSSARKRKSRGPLRRRYKTPCLSPDGQHSTRRVRRRKWLVNSVNVNSATKKCAKFLKLRKFNTHIPKMDYSIIVS